LIAAGLAAWAIVPCHVPFLQASKRQGKEVLFEEVKESHLDAISVNESHLEVAVSANEFN
jgi:hypothetical protein